MKKLIYILSIFLSTTVCAQTYNSHFQIEGANIFGAQSYAHLQLANGNTAMSVTLRDSAYITNPPNNFYNAPSTPTAGSGIVILSATNQVVWHKEWHPTGTNLADRVTISNLIEDNWGNIYITGEFQGAFDINCDAGVQMITPAASNHHNGFIIKLDAMGNFVWGQTIQSATTAFCFMSMYDGYISNTGNLVLTGVFKETMDFDPGLGTQIMQSSVNNYSVYFLTLDSAGSFIDVKTLNRGSSISNILGNVSDVHYDVQGNLYVAYAYQDSLDVDLSSGTKYYYDPLKNGSCLVKYDTAYNIIWDKQMPDNYKRLNFSFPNNNEFYLFTEFDGATVLNDNTPATSNGSEDIVYEKWNSSGNCLWSKTFGGNQRDYISSLEEFNNELYLLYSFEDSVNTNTGSNDAQLYAQDRDIALSRLNLTGQHLTTSVVQSDSTIFLRPHNLLLSGNLIRMYFRNMGTTDVDPSSTNVINITQQWNNSSTQAVVIWNNTPTSTNNITEQKTLSVYPNPSTGQFTIDTDDDYLVEIFSATGQLLYQQQGIKGKNKINVEKIPSGLYLLHFSKNNEKVQSAKISIIH